MVVIAVVVVSSAVVLVVVFVGVIVVIVVFSVVIAGVTVVFRGATVVVVVFCDVVVVFRGVLMVTVVIAAVAHTLKPPPNTLSSLVHTSSAPVSTFTPCGPDSPLNAVSPTLIKSNPVSTSYCTVVRTSGRNAFTLQLSPAPYSP